MVACDPQMQEYVSSQFAWPGVQYCGWIERLRKNIKTGKEERQVSLWLAGAAFSWNLSASQSADLLRGHWSIETGVFYVRDVTMGEDRSRSQNRLRFEPDSERRLEPVAHPELPLHPGCTSPPGSPERPGPATHLLEY